MKKFLVIFATLATLSVAFASVAYADNFVYDDERSKALKVGASAYRKYAYKEYFKALKECSNEDDWCYKKADPRRLDSCLASNESCSDKVRLILEDRLVIERMTRARSRRYQARSRRHQKRMHGPCVYRDNNHSHRVKPCPRKK